MTPLTLGALKNTNGFSEPITAPSTPSSNVNTTTPSLAIQGVVHFTVDTPTLVLPTISDPTLHRTAPTSVCKPETSTLTTVPPLTGPALGVGLMEIACHAS
jgi:hypothetical protein